MNGGQGSSSNQQVHKFLYYKVFYPNDLLGTSKSPHGWLRKAQQGDRFCSSNEEDYLRNDRSGWTKDGVLLRFSGSWKAGSVHCPSDEQGQGSLVCKAGKSS
jgi:hypothetical protein